MTTLTGKSPQELTQEFYSRKLYLSYSGLSKMMYSPSLYYRHYILQQKEEKLDSYLVDGKVIHCLLLDDGSFDKQFILMPDSLPTGNTRSVVDEVYTEYAISSMIVDKITMPNLEDYGDTILASLKRINLHQSLKTDKQRLDKIISEESKSYFQFLKIKGEKTLLDSETLQRCNEAVNAVKADSQSCDLLGLITHEMEHVDIFNEILMKSDLLDVYPFGIKGIIDNIKVSHATKTIHVNDLKTTGKTITDFRETIEYYNYWAQAAIYVRLIKDAFKQLLQEPDWKVVFHFIVVDKYNQVYAFEVSTITMDEWDIRLATELNKFKWHYTERRYMLPYEFAVRQVIL